MPARALRGSESTSLYDPFVLLYLDEQKKDCLKSKVVPKNPNPQWHQEFLLTCSSAESTLTFDVYDHNSLFKNLLLGTATLKLQDVSPSAALHDLWLPLTTQGDLHVLIHFTPLSPHPRKSHLRHTFHQLRVVVNGDKYYPGSEVHGCVVAAVSKPKKVRGVHLHALGCSSTHWTNGASKCKEISLFHVGPHIYPSKLVLPTNIPPSYLSWCGENKYTFNASIDVPGALDKIFTASIVVLSLHTSLRSDEFLSISTLARGAVTKDNPVVVSMQGPKTAFVGENYTFNANVQNDGKKDVVSLQAALKFREYHYAYHSGIKMVRSPGMSVKITAVDIQNIPGFPVKPGTSWTGDITIPIPKGITPTLYSSISPLIQTEYSIKLKIVTSGNVFTKCTGENKYFVSMVARNPDHFPLESPSKLKPGVLYTCPFTDQFYSSLIPRYLRPNPAISYPNAGSLIEMWPCTVNPAFFTDLIEPKQYPGPRMEGEVPTSEWTPGTKPLFVISEPGELKTNSSTAAVNIQDATSSGVN